MARYFEEEAGFYNLVERRRTLRSEVEELEGLQPSNVILAKTGQAVAVALAAGVLLCALLQGLGLR